MTTSSTAYYTVNCTAILSVGVIWSSSSYMSPPVLGWFKYSNSTSFKIGVLEQQSGYDAPYFVSVSSGTTFYYAYVE